MSMKTMTAAHASKKFGEYIDAAQREPVVITKQSRPVAVTLSMQDAEALFGQLVSSGVEKGLSDVKDGRVQELNQASIRDMLREFKNSCA